MPQQAGQYPENQKPHAVRGLLLLLLEHFAHFFEVMTRQGLQGNATSVRKLLLTAVLLFLASTPFLYRSIPRDRLDRYWEQAPKGEVGFAYTSPMTPLDRYPRAQLRGVESPEGVLGAFFLCHVVILLFVVKGMLDLSRARVAVLTQGSACHSEYLGKPWLMYLEPLRRLFPRAGERAFKTLLTPGLWLGVCYLGVHVYPPLVDVWTLAGVTAAASLVKEALVAVEERKIGVQVLDREYEAEWMNYVADRWRRR